MIYDPEDFFYLFEDIESLPYTYLADHQLRVVMLSMLGLSLILYIINVVIKNNIFKTILNTTIVILSVGIFVNGLHNIFVPIYGYALFNSYEGSYAYILSDIFFGSADFEYIASLLLAKMTLKEFAMVSFVSIIIPFSTLVLAFISSNAKCKKDKCCHHQEVVQEEQPIVEEK